MSRLSKKDAERLLAFETPEGDHGSLAALLAAAKAPGTAAELAGERRAVAGFRREYRKPKVVREKVKPRRKTARVLVAAFVVAVVGGSSIIAHTGLLPDPLQRAAHRALGDLGIPAPATPPTRASAPTPSTVPSPDLVALCKTWQAYEKDPKSTAPTDAERKTLSKAAGSEQKIDNYCANLLDQHK